MRETTAWSWPPPAIPRHPRLLTGPPEVNENGCYKEMTQTTDPVTFSVPRTVLSEISRLSDQLTDHMHALLERNADGALSPTERSELETLVRMAEFGQIVSMALKGPQRP